MLRVLMIDDDRELCQLVSVCLVREGMEVKVAHDGRSGFKMARTGQHDLAILDVILPQLTGLQVLKQLRDTSNIGILMLTARGEEADGVMGLEYGADDYLSKPFSARELVARIRTLARRLKPRPDGEMGRAPERLEIDDLTLDEGSRTCRRNGEIIDLTTVEFDLLSLFLRCSGRTVHRKELSKQVLDRDWSPFDRSIDVHVSKLRRKLGSLPDGTERIRGVRTVGYIYAHAVAAQPFAG
jgi:two-component system, OmpR family, response regulator CpxR